MRNLFDLDESDIKGNLKFRLAECININDKDKIVCRYNIEIETIYNNSYTNIKINDNETDYRIDVKLKNKKIFLIYGEIRSVSNKCLKDRIAILYKEIHQGYKCELLELGKISSDSMGMFMFIQDYDEGNFNYKIKVI